MTTALLYLVVFAGGVLTILSPCILPVLPFVLARAGRPFRRETAPMLAGLAASFAFVATAGIAGASWVAGTAELGWWGSLLVLAAAGVTLVSTRAAVAAARPLLLLGARIGRWFPAGGRADVRPISREAPSPLARTAAASPFGALAVGAATGLLWAPCAGPILGLVFAAAVGGGDPSRAASLFLAFALGAATSLAVGLAAGARLLAPVRRHLAADLWIRRGLGTLALAGVGVIALGWDAPLFAGGGLVQTAAAEELLIRRLAPEAAAGAAPLASVFVPAPAPPPLPPPVTTLDEGPFPPLDGATGWINSAPLTREGLRGRVVLVDVWTYECYNCLNALPYVKALHAKYRDQGLVVIGVHTPEFARERVRANVEAATRRLGVTYPVALDNDYKIWRAFNNRFWPAAYYIDRKGRIRYHRFGEGAYAEQERVVQQLLAEPAG